MAQKKIALVTGGSRGLGRDMALSLCRKGIDVILTYYSNKEEGEKVVKELESMGGKAALLQVNVGDIASLDGFVQQVKETLQTNWSTDKFDFLINNGGMGATIPFMQVTEADFDNFTNVHFKGVYFLTQKSLPVMNDGGGIVFVSSGSTRFVVPGYSAYASNKGAVEVLSRYIAKELGNRGIRSNVIAPGATETDFNNAAIRTDPQRKAFLASQTALGRVGQADDIGSVVAFLCTDDAKWVTGQRIEVSGGVNL
ncbi:SDR family NAD(P)-dependent oxidoreductase [Taibaiella soli]|uniref:Short-chain dehydrogenase n=1 Tax=Taibaiella soli TaxID=1649169 RepID=A0A2W2ABP2_9BACT|nr:SDR family oxidoreductase [Taibaiella soli]PZF71032.1 short-chain dehydrogenase [Taibaiella soli]